MTLSSGSKDTESAMSASAAAIGKAKNNSKPKKGPGRIDPQGQEGIIDKAAMDKALPGLVKLKKAMDEASAEYNDAIKATAEKPNMFATTVNKRVRSIADDREEETKRKVEQLAIAFDI